MPTIDWTTELSTDDVCLVLGTRVGLKVDGFKMPVADEAKSALIESCRRHMDALSERSERPYSAMAEIESSTEYQVISVEDAKAASLSVGAGDEPTASTSRLLDLIARIPDLPADHLLDRDDLDDRDKPWQFYVVTTWSADLETKFSFVRRKNPQQVLKSGQFATTFRNSLKRIEAPVFVFEDAFDLVVVDSQIAVLRTDSLEHVLAEMQLIQARVAGHVHTVVDAAGFDFSDGAEVVIENCCRGSVRLAKCLERVASAEYLADVDMSKIEKALARHAIDEARFGSNGSVELGDKEDVKDFLNLLDGRLWEADFSGEPRVAQRFVVR